MLKADIRDYETVRRALQASEIVFHLAAIPSVPRSINDPVPSHECNIGGTFNVFQAAKVSGVRRVVYAASSSAYGDQPGDVRRETDALVPLSTARHSLAARTTT